VIDKAGACPSPERARRVAEKMRALGGDEGEIVEDDAPITASGAKAPAGGGGACQD